MSLESKRSCNRIHKLSRLTPCDAVIPRSISSKLMLLASSSREAAPWPVISSPLFAGSTVEFLFPFNADGVCIGGRGDRVRGEDGGEKKRRTDPEGDLARYL